MSVVLFAKVRKQDAEAAKKKLVKIGIFDKSVSPFSKGSFVFFPVSKKVKSKGIVFVARTLKSASVPPSKKVGVSFDIIGDIAIFEKPREDNTPLGEIAENILELHKNVKTVAVKEGALKGPYRLRKLRIIAGRKRTETIHRESGCLFRVDVTKAYFSPRLSHERERISGQVKSGEVIFVPFAGVGPFAIVIAKKHPDTKVFANELNPDAIKYLKENIRLNKTHNVTVIPGDARGLLQDYRGHADRVVVPLPMMSGQFLDVAFGLAKRGGIVNFYHFTESTEKTIALLQDYAKKAKRKIRVISSRVVRAYSPLIIETVIDFQVI
jgi:tRNA (guanine37-N1)-methyltransferase